MRVRYVLLLTLVLLAFTGIRLTPSEHKRVSDSADDNVQLRSRNIGRNVVSDTPSTNTIERIKEVRAEIVLFAAKRYHPETISSTEAAYNSEEANQLLYDIVHPEEALQILEEMRNSLIYEGKDEIAPELVKRLGAAIGATGGMGTALPWVTAKRSDIVAPPVSQSSHQDEVVMNRGENQTQSSRWIQIGQFDDEFSFRRTVKPQAEVSERSLSIGADEAQLASASPSLPKSYRLNQNYPNPFNPSTTIEFDIPDKVEDTQDVKLSIYDIRGRLVRTLVDEKKGSGHYSIAWDGIDEKGKQVSSGVYLYRISVGKFLSVRKMLLTE